MTTWHDRLQTALTARNLAESDDAAFSSAAGLATRRFRQLNAEVVVMVFLLESHYIELQGVQQVTREHYSPACLSALRMPSLTLPSPSLAAMARLSASR